MPSNSMGFWVANTVNVADSGCPTPSIVTVRSCIASSSAACVFAGARLISSASTRSAKIGPGRNVNSRAPLKSVTPVMSAGIKSGVNWMRWNLTSSERQHAHQQRLGGSGDALEQHVTASEQADERLAGRRLLAEDHAVERL